MYYLLDEEEFFTSAHRRNIINFINHKIIYRNKKMFISNMIEEFVSQYAALIACKRETMDIPMFEGYLGEMGDGI